MKKPILNLITAAAALTFMSTSLQTQANEGDMFVGVMANHAIYESENADDVGLSAVTLRFNYEFLDNHMVETRLSTSFSDHTVNDTEFSLKSLYGAYYSYNYEVTKKLAVYGLAGFSSIEVKTARFDVANTEDQVLVSYGAGFTYQIGKDANVNFEGVLYGDDDVKYAAVGAGIELLF